MGKRRSKKAKAGRLVPRPALRDASPEFCPNCSSALSSLDRFCPACGTLIAGEEEE